MPDKELLQNLGSTVSLYTARLTAFGESETVAPMSPGKWSRKQILGHLIDSASNNHQRFVRAASSELVRFPGYDQNSWVTVQDYSGRSWEELVAFWRHYNDHLLHILSCLPDSVTGNRIIIDGGPEISVAELAADYLRHLQHHLRQIAG